MMSSFHNHIRVRRSGTNVDNDEQVRIEVNFKLFLSFYPIKNNNCQLQQNTSALITTGLCDHNTTSEFRWLSGSTQMYMISKL